MNAIVGIAARQDERKFLIGGQRAERQRTSATQYRLAQFDLVLDRPVWAARLALRRDQALEPAFGLFDEQLESAEVDLLALGIAQRGRELGQPSLVVIDAENQFDDRR